MPTFLSNESAHGVSNGHPAGVVAGEHVFVTGTALDPRTGRRAAAAASIADEVRTCFEVIAKVLQQAGGDLSDLVKTTCWLSEDSHRAEFIDAYRAQLADGSFPARVTMVAGLPGDCRVAIEAVALKSRSQAE